MRKLFVLFALLLAGCQTTGGSTVGSGPITLSPVIQEYFDKYLANHGSIFAVAIDGRSGLNYYYCPDVQCREQIGERQLTIDGCEVISKGVPCKIYAVRDKVIWNFDGPATSVSNTDSSDIRRIDMTWAGHDGAISSEIDLNGSSQKISIDQYVRCYISHTYNAEKSGGTWTMSCTDGQAVKGTFSSLGEGKVAVGRGTDKDGNEVNYVIHPQSDS